MNILLLSGIYPWQEGNRGTPVCHYFAREWVKMGHNVRVVHNQNVFPMPFYWLARLNREKIAAKTGAVVYTKRDRGAQFVMDGVQIKRIPILKMIPHGKFTQMAIKHSITQIVDWLNKEKFEPNVIVGHFPIPQIEMVGMLHEVWPNAKSAMVMHGDVALTKKVYGDRLLGLCKKIDVWGFRSNAERFDFESNIMPIKRSFDCYSGIPDDFLTTENKHDFSQPLHSFVYVGGLVDRKYPEKIIDALQKAYPAGDYHMTYVGDGGLMSDIQEKIAKEGLTGKVTMLGKIPRNSIKAEYDAADCMVMISRGEVYGLVYLEAMARGCITIASRGEGFDGVIKDGENGFLCKAGDADELAKIICRINELSPDERQRISDNALETAKSLTDYKAAKRYIEDLLNA